jgi:hypothetical protein
LISLFVVWRRDLGSKQTKRDVWTEQWGASEAALVYSGGNIGGDNCISPDDAFE